MGIEKAVLEICEEKTEVDIVGVLARAVGSRRTTAERLRSAALSATRTRNRRFILEVLAEVAEGIESPLERHYLIDVERAHRLPVASRQVSISDGTRSDVAYLEFLVIVELDGRLWHEGLAAWTDMERDNRHRLASFTTLRFGWEAVMKDPCNVASQVVEALRQGGWTGVSSPCPRCF